MFRLFLDGKDFGSKRGSKKKKKKDKNKKIRYKIMIYVEYIN